MTVLSTNTAVATVATDLLFRRHIGDDWSDELNEFDVVVISC